MDITCHYIRINGVRCGSPKIAGKNFCFWHSKINRHHAEADATSLRPKHYNPMNEQTYRQENELIDHYFSTQRVNGPLSKEIPPLEDPESIQFALSVVIASMADGRIEDKRAALMLYGLQIASQNVRRIQVQAENPVQDVTVNEFGLEIVPPQEDPLPGSQQELTQTPAEPTLELLEPAA